MSTRAIQYLKQKGVPFEVLKYEHREKGAEFAAKATGMPLEQTVKTLVVALSGKTHVLALVPGHMQLNLKKTAAACREKKAAMADTETAQRLTGYLVGGISPFNTRKRLPVIMEKYVLRWDFIALNAGQRGVMLRMKPGDVIKAIDGRVADIGDAI